MKFQTNIRFNRVWSMPNKNTFEIKPIAELLNSYVGNGKNWIDPFARNSKIAMITNDLSPETSALFHLHANDFINQLPDIGYNGVLFDPPYSLRQVKECYDGIGISMSFDDSKMFPTNVKNSIAPKIKPNGTAICCGWDSTGFGKNRGFELIELLLVCHGGRHNDTIVTVERKFNTSLDAFNTST